MDAVSFFCKTTYSLPGRNKNLKTHTSDKIVKDTGLVPLNSNYRFSTSSSDYEGKI
jgi:hypothetical protein